MKIYNEPLSINPLEKHKKEEEIEDKELSQSTLFVSTIPFDATNEDLLDFFSTIAPVRSCFIITSKGADTHKGCGYVQYATKNDALLAMKNLKNRKFKNKRSLKISLALKKSIVSQRKLDGIPIKSIKASQKIPKKIQKLSSKKLASKTIAPQLFNSTTILISKLPSVPKNVLYKKVRKFGSVANLIVSGQSDETLLPDSAKVVYSTPEEAQSAKKHLHDHTYKGVKITCEIVRTITEASLAKKSRLIIRNLAFQCKKSHLMKVFEPFGEIVDCNLPEKDGKIRGFAFVQFKNLEDATNALQTVNGTNILHRPVAVDWALGKAQFDRLVNEDDAEEEDVSPGLEVQAINQQDEAISQDSGEESDTEESDCPQNEANDAIIYDSDQDATMSEHESDTEPESKEYIEDCTLFVRNLSFDTTKESLHQKFSKWGALRYALITKDKVTGISRGNGFVCFRKVESAKACLAEFEQAAGIIAAYHPVVAEETDSKDKKRKSIMTPAIPQSVAQETAMFSIDGRFINVTPSVSKQIATKISHASTLNRRANDKRHLYLIREGVVFPGSEAANQLTPEELEHRMQQFANRKRLLATNPNLFISRTRLSVRGLDPKLTDTQLRNAAKIAVRGFWDDVDCGNREGMEEEVVDEEVAEGLGVPGPKRKVWVKQAKIIREADRIDSVTKKPKSKGYGFIEFTSHADAIACLRFMNNNTACFLKAMDSDKEAASGKKKPVVEFAVENRLVLKKRTERNKNGVEKPKSVSKGKETAVKRKRDGDDVVSKKKAAITKDNPAPFTKRKDITNDQTQKSSEAPQNNAPKKKKEFKTFKERREIRKAKSMESKKPNSDASTSGNQVEHFLSKTKETKTPSRVSKKSIDKVASSTRPSKREVQRIKKTAEEQSFETLVSSYKKKINPSAMTQQLKKKWFE